MKSSIRISKDGNTIHATGNAANELFKALTQPVQSKSERYSKYLDYIKNAGGSPSAEWFDDDWSPIGQQVRAEMTAAGLIRVIEGKVYLA